NGRSSAWLVLYCRFAVVQTKVGALKALPCWCAAIDRAVDKVVAQVGNRLETCATPKWPDFVNGPAAIGLLPENCWLALRKGAKKERMKAPAQPTFAREASMPPSPEVKSLRDLSPQQWRSGTAAWLGWTFDGLDM